MNIKNIKRCVLIPLIVIILASLILCVVNIGFVCNKSSSELELFTQSVTTLIREAEQGNIDTAPYSENYTCRLIVKADGNIDKRNAVNTAEGYNSLHILQFANEQDTQSALDYYNSLDGVDFVQLDKKRKICGIESQSVEASSTATDASLNPEASKFTGILQLREYLTKSNITYSREIVVGVVDTGIEHDHELLEGRVIQNENNYSTDDQSDSYDNNGHGTHVAGIIVNNTLDNVSVKPYKVLDEKGSGYDSECYLGIESAVNDGVDVINMSFGGPGDSELLTEAIEDADAEGIVCVAAAGNDGVCMDGAKNHYSPASIPQCITVVAVSAKNIDNPENSFFMNSRTSRAQFSNYGSCCDFNAPGVAIRSSFIGNTYRSLNGTSMAAPFVSAAVTYVLLDKPDLKPDEVCRRMKDYSICKDPNSYYSLYIEYITRTIEKLQSPRFSVQSSEFDEDFYLELSSDVKDAVIMYRLPTYADYYWRRYKEPIKIHNDTTIIAYAAKVGQITSDIVNNTYTRIYSDEENKFVISDSGEITEYLYNASEDELVIPDTINSIVPTSIGKNVFMGRDFESVYIPDSVKVIGNGAFKNCKSLTSVVANGVESISGFSGCDKLEYIDCKNVNVIDTYAFSGCNSLNDFDFTNIRSIGSYAFSNCFGITYISSDSIEKIDSAAFKGSGIYTLNAPYAKTLGMYAFQDAQNLQNINLESIKTIQQMSFKGCTSLESITLPMATSLSSEVFYNSALKEVHLPRISSLSGSTSVFANCKSLENIDIPNLKVLGERAFTGCDSLKSIRLPLVEKIDGAESCFSSCSSLESVFLPSVTSIKSKYVFNGCDSLTAVYMPSLKSTASLPNNDNVSVYLSDELISCTAALSEQGKIIAPSDSFAESWANSKGCVFLDCCNCSLSRVSDNNFVYKCSVNKEECAMPVEMVNYLWNIKKPINENSDYEIHAFLFDVVPDGFINVGDYAKIRSLTKAMA